VLTVYVQQGKRSYAMVSELCGDQAKPPPRLFRHLAGEFELCLHGLRLVRKAWENAQKKQIEGPQGDLIL